MGVDFSAVPSEEGLKLAAQLRREQRERIAAELDGADVQEQQDVPTASPHTTTTPASSAADRPGSGEVEELHDRESPDRHLDQPGSGHSRTTEPSFLARLEALAAASSPSRSADRQR